VVADVVDDYSFDAGAEGGDYAIEQVVGHRSRGLDAFEPAVDGEDFDDADDDGEASLAIAFFEDDYLLVGRLVYYYF